MKVLKLHEAEASYCDYCDNATIVGVFTLKSWHHTFRVCGNCLQKMVEAINAKNIDLTKLQEGAINRVPVQEK